MQEQLFLSTSLKKQWEVGHGSFYTHTRVYLATRVCPM